jgi:hypothetical protein
MSIKEEESDFFVTFNLQMKENLQLNIDGIITDEQSSAIDKYENEKPLSVHWELRTILYLGVLLFTSGISILVYKNIDTIGHQVILAIIAIACVGCFYYGYKHRLPYSNEQTKHPSPFFDYIVLLGCLLFGTFIGYVQFQYNLFGLHYGVAVLFPTLVFFFCAYTFDHKGILSLGIAGLAAWAGLTVTPLDLIEKNNFSDTTIIYTSIILGLFILVFSIFSDNKKIKTHFSFSYNTFAANLLFIGSLAALFDLPFKWLSFLLIAGLCYYYIVYAIKQHSFFFLLLSVVYGYICLTYCVFTILPFHGESTILLVFFYISASGIGVIRFFTNYKKILRIEK